MGNFSDDKNYDEFMNASSDEWSKPEPPPASPQPPVEPTDRWGSPLPDPSPAADEKPKASEKPTASRSVQTPEKKKSGSNWWVILIIVLVVLCLCLCLAIFILPILGISIPLFSNFRMEQFMPILP